MIEKRGKRGISVAMWNLWHGCHKLSEGCRNCYVYRTDARHGRDSTVVAKTGDFDLPLRKKRDGSYKLPAGETVYTCFTSDFFVEDADGWRPQAWEMMRRRGDLNFMMITKRIDRFYECLPRDWGEGYENVMICCTAENQDRANYRLPIYESAPIRHKAIICEPLLCPVNLRPFLGPWIERVVAGGESGPQARICQYDWILSLRAQCIERGVDFYFKQTGYRFVRDGALYHVARRYQHSQALKAGINVGRDYREF